MMIDETSIYNNLNLYKAIIWEKLNNIECVKIIDNGSARNNTVRVDIKTMPIDVKHGIDWVGEIAGNIFNKILYNVTSDANNSVLSVDIDSTLDKNIDDILYKLVELCQPQVRDIKLNRIVNQSDDISQVTIYIIASALVNTYFQDCVNFTFTTLEDRKIHINNSTLMHTGYIEKEVDLINYKFMLYNNAYLKFGDTNIYNLANCEVALGDAILVDDNIEFGYNINRTMNKLIVNDINNSIVF